MRFSNRFVCERNLQMLVLVFDTNQTKKSFSTRFFKYFFLRNDILLFSIWIWSNRDNSYIDVRERERDRKTQLEFSIQHAHVNRTRKNWFAIVEYLREFLGIITEKFIAPVDIYICTDGLISTRQFLLENRQSNCAIFWSYKQKFSWHFQRNVRESDSFLFSTLTSP